MRNMSLSPTALWQLTPCEFNEWRIQNDIPFLFQFLQKKLPLFDKWIEHCGIDYNILMKVIPTGDLFKGDERKIIVKKIDLTGSNIQVYECFSESQNKVADSHIGTEQDNNEIIGTITPYFLWLKYNGDHGGYFCHDQMNKQYSNTFVYNLHEIDPLNRSKAFLFKEFDALKLGQVEIQSMVHISGRNLDFTDMDSITITGDFHGSLQANISYSSCQNMKITGAQLAFFTFYQCHMDKIEIYESRIQDFYFCCAGRITITAKDSQIIKMKFKDTTVVPLLYNCELREVNFSSKKDAPPHDTASTYRLLRIAFQNSGMRREASESYYKERIFERKSYFRPYLEHRSKFSGIYNGNLMDFIKKYKNNIIDKNTFRNLLYKYLKSTFKLYTLPKYLFPLIAFRSHWIYSMIDYLIWGYGERPSRIFSLALFLIILYASGYHYLPWPDDEKGYRIILDWVDSLYFSTVTFTTLGYGDITPKTTLLKILCSSESLLGAATMGLAVAGFSNRSRY
ncbi:ion channel [Nitrospirillum viridazoti]|nr:ion channel [Nitrospirillum amazonense]